MFMVLCAFAVSSSVCLLLGRLFDHFLLLLHVMFWIYRLALELDRSNQLLRQICNSFHFTNQRNNQPWNVIGRFLYTVLYLIRSRSRSHRLKSQTQRSRFEPTRDNAFHRSRDGPFPDTIRVRRADSTRVVIRAKLA